MALFKKNDTQDGAAAADTSSKNSKVSGTTKASDATSGWGTTSGRSAGPASKTNDKNAGKAAKGTQKHAAKAKSTKQSKDAGDKAVARVTRQAKKNGPTKAQVKREEKKKLGKVGKYVLVAIGIAAMVLSVSAIACSGVINEVSSDDDEDYTLTGGVAATVQGVNITEDTVTEQIMSVRESGGYDSDEDWATYLNDQGQTPESLRESIIDSLARQYLITEAIDEYDITVSDDEIQDAWDEQVEQYGDEDTFLSLIEMYGYTEDTYKEQIESSLAQEKLTDEVAPLEDATDEEIIEYVNENLDTLNDARRSSNILFSVDSDATDEEREEVLAEAQDVLDQINAGELDFADAAEEYSDDSSADDGGDVGWDKLTSFVTEYQDALSELSEGEVSGIVESDYGYHIIMCTGYFHVDDEVTSIDQIPENLRDTISDTLASQDQTTAYSEWFDQYVEDADIQINDMPEDVPYNVDMSLAETDDDADDESTDDSTDASSGESLESALEDAATDEDVTSDDETASSDEAASSDGTTDEG